MGKNLSDQGKNRLQHLISQSKAQIKKIIPADITLFVVQFIKHPVDIGALAPSSTHLAEAMTRFVQNTSDERKYYLEAGAGTGAFTKTLIEKLGPNDHLDIIEINPKFCRRLKEKYSQFSNVCIHVGSVLDWKPSYKYNVIVSSLPFNAFKANFVSEIYRHYQQITKQGAYLSYCEYMGLPEIRKLFLSPRNRKILQDTLDVTLAFEKKYQTHLDKVFANLPPALVHHCQFLKQDTH